MRCASRAPLGSFTACAAGLLGESGFQLFIELGRADGPGGFAEPLDVVERAPLGQEDVDDKIHIIEQNPFSLAASLDGIGQGAEVALEAELDLVGDGYGLAIVGRRGHEEKVGKAGIDGVELQDAGVLAFLVFAGCGGGLNQDTGLLVGSGCCHSNRYVSRFIVTVDSDQWTVMRTVPGKSAIEAVRVDVSGDSGRERAGRGMGG